MSKPNPAKLSEARNKYGAKPTEYNGRRYHSAAEARQAAELDILVKCRKAINWTPQVPFPINVEGVYICTVVVDFMIKETPHHCYYIETKGRETPVSKLKRKLLMACYPGIDYRLNGVKQDQPRLRVQLGAKA
jgi:hypothetical protein